MIASSGVRSGLPRVSMRLNAPVEPTNCSEFEELLATVWFSVGPRNVEPTDTRAPKLGVICHFSAAFGSVVEPVSLP